MEAFFTCFTLAPIQMAEQRAHPTLLDKLLFSHTPTTPKEVDFIISTLKLFICPRREAARQEAEKSGMEKMGRKQR